MGKGSKRRPMKVAYTTYDSNWDKIFGKKPKKELASKELLAAMKKDLLTFTGVVSEHWSENGKRHAIVLHTEQGYCVEFYEKSRLKRTVEVFDKSLQYAEDAAENWCLGLME